MLAMVQIHDIRKLFFEEGKNISQVAKATNCDRKTVRHYLDKEYWNMSVPETEHEAKFPKLDQYKLEIDSWLTDDKKAKRKQRHTPLW